MRKVILVTSLFITISTVNGQRNTMINTKDLSPFSVGAMPVIFVSSEDGPGLGLELNARYGITKEFGVGIFGRMKSIMKDNSSYYDGYGSSNNSVYYGDYGSSDNIIESTNVFAVGAALDYHLFNAVALQLRGGMKRRLMLRKK